jgi:hypothetical protein
MVREFSGPPFVGFGFAGVTVHALPRKHCTLPLKPTLVTGLLTSV